jgi:hypothetical protein
LIIETVAKGKDKAVEMDVKDADEGRNVKAKSKTIN